MASGLLGRVFIPAVFQFRQVNHLANIWWMLASFLIFPFLYMGYANPTDATNAMECRITRGLESAPQCSAIADSPEHAAREISLLKASLVFGFTTDANNKLQAFTAAFMVKAQMHGKNG